MSAANDAISTLGNAPGSTLTATLEFAVSPVGLLMVRANV